MTWSWSPDTVLSINDATKLKINGASPLVANVVGGDAVCTYVSANAGDTATLSDSSAVTLASGNPPCVPISFTVD